MADNVSNITEHCLWARSAGDLGLFVTYKLITPFYFFAGLFGNILCIVAFRQKVKGETAFAYQIMFTVNQFCEIISCAVYATAVVWWSGTGGPVWFRSCYVCMWFTARIIGPLVNMLLTNALFLTLATSVNRIFALWKPFVYKNINHKRHQAIASIICGMVSTAVNVFDCFSLYPADIDGNGLYAITVDVEYTSSLTVVILAHVRDAVRLSAAIVLIVANAFMIYLYKKNAKKVSPMVSSNSMQAQKKRALQKVVP